VRRASKYYRKASLEWSFANGWIRELYREGREPTDEEVASKIGELRRRITETDAVELADATIAGATGALAASRQDRSGFEERLRLIWSRSLDLLETLLGCVVEIGQQAHQSSLRRAVREQNLVFEAVFRLHARACRTSDEVIILLRTGHASGAMARVRSLEELVFTAMFVREHGGETANRYILHERATAYARAVEHNRFANQLNEEPFTAAEIFEMRAERDRLISQFDTPCFTTDYGWALTALGRACSEAAHTLKPKTRHSVTFRDIERAVDMEHYRPYYGLGSRAIHADSRHLYWDLGLDENPEMLLYGASNGGLVEPLALCAHLLVLLATQATLASEATADRMVQLLAVTRIGEAVRDAAAEDQATYETRVAEEGAQLKPRVRRAKQGRVRRVTRVRTLAGSAEGGESIGT
jgi:hypothetical protein